jgi:hypothetical protein
MKEITISGAGIPRYSMLGVTQTLSVVASAMQTRRTVNGNLVNIAAPQFHKYRSTITSC